MARINPTAITLAIVLASLLTVHPILNHQFRHGEKIVGIGMVPRPTLFSLGARRLHPWTPVAVVPITVPPPITDATSTDTRDWACIKYHESTDNYGAPGGGAWQFENGTWKAVTGLPGPAQDYSVATQNAAALKLYSQRGFEPWTTRWICGLG